VSQINNIAVGNPRISVVFRGSAAFFRNHAGIRPWNFSAIGKFSVACV